MTEAKNASWGGRFAGAPAKAAADYTASESFDRVLYAQDIRGSIAHAKMLASRGILDSAETQAIVTGLEHIRKEIEKGEFSWKRELEDVHMNIESRLVELIGDTGKKLHTGRSRNDQVGLTFRLYVAECCAEWRRLCIELCSVLLDLARANVRTLMPGYTHLQPAQPVSLAQHLLAYAGMFRRDCGRIADALERIRISPLGAAALAGSTYPLDPYFVAREVGFPDIYANSMDAVSDRDFVLEALFCASVISMHLSRICEEIAIWTNPCFGFIRLPDAFSTGSSIMPQKKNPDVAELTRGKTGRVYGNLMAMLTVMKGLPLTYNSDLQEDKEGFFDTDRTVRASLQIVSAMLAAVGFNEDAMRAACSAGFLNATEIADYLAAKGVPFREAHHIAGRAVALAEAQKKKLEELSLTELQELSPLIAADIFASLDYDRCVQRRETPGGTGPASVERQIGDLEKWLEEQGK